MGNLKHIGTLYIIIIMLLSCIIITDCNKSKKSDIITIPEKTGMLLDSLPKEIKRDTNPVDTVYITKFIKADSTGKIEQYIDAIAEREYSNTVEDSLIKINYHAFTQGRLKDIKFDYTIKPVTINVPKTKESVFSIYAGVGLKTTYSLESLTPTLQLGIQGKNGNMFVGSISSDKTIQAGYVFRIINIKK